MDAVHRELRLAERGLRSTHPQDRQGPPDNGRGAPARFAPRTSACLDGRGLPRSVLSVGGPILDKLFAAWSALVLGKPADGVERVRRFDSAFDDVTSRCMPWEGYWSPHDADFLNWRYFSDPVREHIAFALAVGATLTGYAVVRVGSGKASLMELVAPREQPLVARTLLLHAIKAASDAGCSHLAVAAPREWRHCRLLRSAGFLSRPSDLVMYAFSWRDDEAGVQRLENWQFVGGDLDPFAD